MKLRFSDRIGVTKVPEVLQTSEMNTALRNSLWNYLLTVLFFWQDNVLKLIIESIWAKFLKQPVDILPYYGDDRLKALRSIYFSNEFCWYRVYNLIEFIAYNYDNLSFDKKSVAFKNGINEILEEEMSGYRFIGDVLAPITNTDELKSITMAIEVADSEELFGTKKHLESAIILISQKPNPDHRNSIKESISAIESLAKQITGEASGGLEKALTKLDSSVKFHGAFKAGLLSLYGYTSDEDGIRHAILEEKDVGFDEAKFMLVTCSAFVNFLISKASKHELL